MQVIILSASILLLIIGLACIFALSRIIIQTSAGGTWTGPATILYFFVGVLRIALPLFLLRTLKNPSLMNITLTATTAFPILQSIIFSGRRQPTVAFLITVGLCLFIVKSYVPPPFSNPSYEFILNSYEPLSLFFFFFGGLLSIFDLMFLN